MYRSRVTTESSEINLSMYDTLTFVRGPGHFSRERIVATNDTETTAQPCARGAAGPLPPVKDRKELNVDHRPKTMTSRRKQW